MPTVNVLKYSVQRKPFMQHIFNRFGVPEFLVSDNGTAFISVNFSDFCQKNGIKHIRIPSFHPQSNRRVGQFVDTFKRVLQKFIGEGTVTEILETLLTNNRAAPHPERLFTYQGSDESENLIICQCPPSKRTKFLREAYGNITIIQPLS